MVNTWNMALKNYSGAEAAMEDYILAWRLDKNSDLVKFMHAAKESQCRLLHHAKSGLIARCIFSLIISYIDISTDLLLAALFFSKGETLYGGITLTWPLIVLAFQGLIAWANKEHFSIVILSFLGLKPFLDTYRFVVDAKVNAGQHSAVISMGLSRAIELVFETLPQIGFQIFLVLLQTSRNENVDSTQYATIVSSLLALGLISATMDYDVDTSQDFRKREPKLYGWILDSKIKRFAFMLCHIGHLGCFAGMRITSYAAIALVSPLCAAVWLSVEILAFLVGRAFFNTSSFFKPCPNIVQHLFTLLTFILSSFVPIWFLRNPYTTVCGRQFTSTLLYGYIAPFAMIAVSMHINAKNAIISVLLHDCLGVISILATTSSVLLGTCAVFLTNPKYGICGGGQ